MQVEIIVALISFAGTALGAFAGVLASSKLTNFRIEQLEKKVEKHNQVIDRVYKLEETNAVEEKELKVINHRIDDLENYHR